jgi:hypothetical protein
MPGPALALRSCALVIPKCRRRLRFPQMHRPRMRYMSGHSALSNGSPTANQTLNSWQLRLSMNFSTAAATATPFCLSRAAASGRSRKIRPLLRAGPVAASE